MQQAVDDNGGPDRFNISESRQKVRLMLVCYQLDLTVLNFKQYNNALSGLTVGQYIPLSKGDDSPENRKKRYSDALNAFPGGSPYNSHTEITLLGEVDDFSREDFTFSLPN